MAENKPPISENSTNLSPLLDVSREEILHESIPADARSLKRKHEQDDDSNIHASSTKTILIAKHPPPAQRNLLKLHPKGDFVIL